MSERIRPGVLHGAEREWMGGREWNQWMGGRENGLMEGESGRWEKECMRGREDGWVGRERMGEGWGLTRSVWMGR